MKLEGDTWVWIGGAAAVGLALALALVPTQTLRPQIVAAKGAGTVAAYLQAASRVAQISNGFIEFGLAVAHRESKFNNLARNTDPPEVAASCNLWEGNWHYENSPYGRNDFCIGSGGWYGFLPATGLAPKVFNNQNPLLIFDPAASTAMFAAYVEAIARIYFPKLPSQYRNWLSIRRSQASLSTMYDYDESGSRSREVKERLAEDLRAIGASPNLMYLRPSIGNYPGAQEVWEYLKAL